MAERTKFSERLEQKISQIQSGEPSSQTVKKRNFSRILLLVNIVILVAVFFFAENLKRRPELYNEQKVRVADITYSFSSVTSSKGYIFTLGLLSSVSAQIVLPEQSVSVTLCDSDNNCETAYFTTTDAPVILEAGKNQNIYLSMERKSLKKRPVGLTYFLTRKIKYSAKLKINADPDIELSLEL